MMNTEKMFLLDKIHLPYADFCFLANLKDKKGGFTYKDKDGKVTTYTYDYDKKFFPVPNTIFGGKLVYAAMPDVVEKCIDVSLVDAESLKRIKNLKEDDNQVLIIYELKD